MDYGFGIPLRAFDAEIKQVYKLLWCFNEFNPTLKINYHVIFSWIEGICECNEIIIYNYV